MIKQRRMLEVENTRLQMAMIAYSTLDIFDEKQRVVATTKEESKDAKDEPTYLGLVLQSFISCYELDIYAHISLTNVKFVLFKNEPKLNPLKANPGERHIKHVFDNLHKIY